MSNKRKLAREILGLFGATAVVSVFFFGFLSMTAKSLVLAYSIKKDFVYTESQQWAINSWIQSISFVMAAVLFVILFLFLAGQKIGYISEIIIGIESLRVQRMDYEIPIEGNNELTELAESINFLAKTERELQLKETLLREEREGLIRALSHDIRTPLTVIRSYSEYMQSREDISSKEFRVYIDLMQQKAGQIKELTDRLLNGGRTLEKFENGRFLMEQLAAEWEMILEEEFLCSVDLEECPVFSGEFDIQELRRIFDNLASNVKKYANPEKTVFLKIYENENNLLIAQRNETKQNTSSVESNGIGLKSIRKIAENYGGSVKVLNSQQEFQIIITLMK